MTLIPRAPWALALLATGLVTSLAPPGAAAAGPGVTDRVLVVTGSLIGSPEGVEAFAPPLGQRSPFGPDYASGQVNLLDLDVSAGGDRVATVESTSQGQRVVVRDASGALVRVVGTSTPTAPDLRTVRITPDGNRVVWRQGVDGQTCCDQVHDLWTAPVAGGAPRKVPGTRNMEVLDALTEDLALVLTDGTGSGDDQGYRTLTLSSGASRPVVGLPYDVAPLTDNLRNRDVSLDGSLTRAAYVLDTSSGGDRDEIRTATVTLSGEVLTTGPSTTLLTGAVGAPQWSHDGTSVYVARATGTDFRSDLYAVPAAGGTPSALGPLTPQDETSAFALQTETSAPAAPTSAGPVVRVGGTARVPYAVPADPTASLVVATRTSPGLPAKALRAVVPAPLVDTGVVAGRTYTYSLRQVDRSGNVGPVVTTVLRQSAPAAAVRVSGQQLTAGQLLRSTNGVRLRVNPDGNLVALSPSGDVLFQTRTRGTAPVLRVKADGNLVLLSGSRVLWHSRTAGQGTVALVAQGDGNVVLYRDRDGRAVWSTRTGRLL